MTTGTSRIAETYLKWHRNDQDRIQKLCRRIGGAQYIGGELAAILSRDDMRRAMPTSERDRLDWLLNRWGELMS